MNPLVGEEDLKDLHIVFESLRNSFSLLAARLPRFLLKVLVFRDPTGTPESVEHFWVTLGASEDWLPEFVRVSPRWVDGRLNVNSCCRDDPTFLAPRPRSYCKHSGCAPSRSPDGFLSGRVAEGLRWPCSAGWAVWCN